MKNQLTKGTVMPQYNLPHYTNEATPRLLKAMYNSPLLMGDVHNEDHTRQLILMFARTRSWFREVHNAYSFHPVVKQFIKDPELTIYLKDWRELILEWPHKSEDGTQLAYTQSDEKGMRDLFTCTSVTKFIRRHAPTIPDHVLRDFCALHDEAQGTYKHLTTTEQFVWAVEHGPKSCMQFGNGEGEETDDEGNYNSDYEMPPEGMHPYDVYRPEYGWSMYVRMVGGKIMGRCLCHNQTYVRTYKRCPQGGYSHSDTALEAYLNNQGYEHLSEWPTGTKVAAIDIDSERYVMPYIDGHNRNLSLKYEDGREVFVISHHGDFLADRTDGEVTGDDRVECDSCGDLTDPEDLYGVGEDHDQRVCEHCHDHQYAVAYGYEGRQYHAPIDDCTYVEYYDDYYVTEYLSDNDIVECRDARGDYEYRNNDDCWYCYESEEYYTDDVPHVIDDTTGNTYHLDHIPDHLKLNEDGELVAIEVTPATTVTT
jgi:hypothetical protein